MDRKKQRAPSTALPVLRHFLQLLWLPRNGRLKPCPWGLSPSVYFVTAAVSNLPPRIHSRMVRYCQLSSLPCQRWPPLWVAR
jgi:hypothetical protein